MDERERYRPPDPGAPDSADPDFRARVRPCGRCGSEFTTTAKWRYFCERCRQTVDVRNPSRHTVVLPSRARRGGAE